MNDATQKQYWDFREVPKLVKNHLTEAFGHKFVLRRNKQEQHIYVDWELGPSRDAVNSFISEHFPRIWFNTDMDMREHEPSVILDGRRLDSYWYLLKRTDFFDAPTTDISRLVASESELERLNWLGFTAFEQAVRDRNEARAIALFQAGASFHRCHPDRDLHDLAFRLPALWALIDSKFLATEISTDAVQRGRRRL